MKKSNFSNIVLLNADEFNANNNINEYDSVVASNSLANYGFVAINTDTNDVVDDDDILEEIYEGEMKNKCFTKNYSVKLNGLSREEMADAIEKVIAIEGNAYQFNHEQRDYSNITLHFKFSGLSDCFTAIFLDVVKYNENGEERWLINIYGSKRGRSENLYHAKDIIPDGNYAFPFKEAKSAMEQTFGFSMVNGFDNKEMHDKCLEAMKKKVEHLATITDVEYDEDMDEFDVEFQNGCYTIHLGWDGCTVDANSTLYEADLDAIHHLLEDFGNGEFNEFFPKAEVA